MKMKCKNMLEGLRSLSDKYGVSEKDLDFIGIMDGVECQLYLYNIIDESHIKFRSTVAYKVLCLNNKRCYFKKIIKKRGLERWKK